LVLDNSLVIDDLERTENVTAQVARARSTLLSLMADAGFDAEKPGRDQPLTLRGCTFAHASFVNAALRGSLFEDCVFAAADFAGASLARASFVSCTLDGVDFTKANDAHLAAFDAESSAGAIFTQP
jgi:uncharacterized protein YjbI with pentapeptide repeats